MNMSNKEGSQSHALVQSNVGAQESQIPKPKMAVEFVRDRFPFANYMDQQVPACISISKAIMRHLIPTKTVRILDFGCGPCDKTAVISTLGYRCSAYDDLQDEWCQCAEARQAIFSFAAKMGIDFRIANGKRREFPWEPSTFDLVMLNDIIEHLHDSPRTLLNRLLPLLKEDGLLLITVPSAVAIHKRLRVLFGHTNLPRFDTYFWYPDPWRGHIREYTKGDLRLLARNLGLSIVELLSCDDHMLQRIPALFRPSYLAVTGVFRGWKDSWLMIAKKGSGWKPKEITEAGLTQLLPRPMLAGTGGNTRKCSGNGAGPDKDYSGNSQRIR